MVNDFIRTLGRSVSQIIQAGGRGERPEIRLTGGRLIESKNREEFCSRLQGSGGVLCLIGSSSPTKVLK